MHLNDTNSVCSVDKGVRCGVLDLSQVPVNQDFWDEHPTKVRSFARENSGRLHASNEADRPQIKAVVLGMSCVQAVVKLLRVLSRAPWKVHHNSRLLTLLPKGKGGPIHARNGQR